MQNDALTLRRLRTFLTVADAGSFNKAADRLLMTQSAVSQQVQQLEQGLGVALFERTSRGVRLTEAGLELRRHAQTVIETVSETQRAMEAFLARDVPQTLTVGASSGLATYVLPPLLQQFQAANPQVALSLRTAATQRVVAMLRANEIDFGLVAGGMGDLDMAGIGRKTLRSFDYLVVVHQSHPWASLQAVSPPALAAAPYINRQPQSRTRRWQEAQLASYGIHLTTASELDSPGTIKYALLSNMGVSILPAYTVAREVAQGELAALPIEGVHISRPVVLLWNEQRTDSEAHRSFHSLLADGT